MSHDYKAEYNMLGQGMLYFLHPTKGKTIVAGPTEAENVDRLLKIITKQKEARP